LTLGDVLAARLDAEKTTLMHTDDYNRFIEKVVLFLKNNPSQDKQVVITPHCLVHYTLGASRGDVALVDYSSGETVSYVRSSTAAGSSLEFSAEQSSPGAVALDPANGGLTAIQTEIGERVAELLNEELQKYRDSDTGMFSEFSDDQYLSGMTWNFDHMKEDFVTSTDKMKAAYGFESPMELSTYLTVASAVALGAFVCKYVSYRQAQCLAVDDNL